MTLVVFRISKLLYALALLFICIPSMVFRRIIFKKELTKNIYQRRALNVIVNGPSLELDVFRPGDLCLCANQFCLSSAFSEVRPDFYILLDPRYAESRDESCSFFKGVEALNDRTQWPLTLILPTHFKKSIEIRVTNKNIRIFSYPTTSFPATEVPTPLRPHLYSAGWMTPPASNVLVHAIYIALQFGFKRIDLHGADMSFFQNIKRGADGSPSFERKHFYGSEDVPLGISMERFFLEQYRSFASFADLEKVARLRDAKIVNRSQQSMIDVFDTANSNINVQYSD
jgi:hypothetical protein